jgi:hypothetical protein
MSQPEHHGYFWRNLLRAVEVEPKDINSLRGSSGIDHPLTAIGVDQARRRLVVISSEGDPRTSAFIQSDLQLAFTDAKVIVARPEMFDRHSAIGLFADVPELIETDNFAEAIAKSPRLNEVMAHLAKSLRLTASLEFWKDDGLGSQTLLTYLTLFVSAIFRLVPPDQRATAFLPMMGFSSGADALVGICGIPIYQLTEGDAEVIKSGGNLGDIQGILRRLDTLQYFFPPPDSLALGLIERAAPTTDLLVTQLQSSIEFGHPFAQNEIVPPSASLPMTIDTLREKGYVMEGERTLEITETGKTLRETIKFKPRESLISKIISQFSIKLDLKDLFNK